MLLKDTNDSSNREPLFGLFSSFRSQESALLQTLAQVVESVTGGLERYEAYRLLLEDKQRVSYRLESLLCFTVGGLNRFDYKVSEVLQQYNSCLIFRLMGLNEVQLKIIAHDVYTYGLIGTLTADEFFLFVDTDLVSPEDTVSRNQYANEFLKYARQQFEIPGESILLLPPKTLCWPASNSLNVVNPSAWRWTAELPLESSNQEKNKTDESERLLPNTTLLQAVEEEMKQLDQPADDSDLATTDPQLARLIEREKKLKLAACAKIVFGKALINRQETGIIGRNTINVIQGATGHHKSRLAELLAALLLKKDDNSNTQFIGFDRPPLERFCVVYLDTERNQREELPFAIQSIKLQAGFTMEETPTDQVFRCTSIKGENRADRFKAIKSFIQDARQKTELHLFCLIDVVSDAVGDFNDPKQSMELFDFLGTLSDESDATFLLVIHQNPGAEKARGHIGTEASNKASTVLQIGLEKDVQGRDTDLIKLRYLKLRRGKRPEPLYLQFCPQSNSLQLADNDQLSDHLKERKKLAKIDDVAETLENLLKDGPMPKREVITALMEEFEAKDRTIRDRLAEIREKEIPLYDQERNRVCLTEFRKGRAEFYQLKEAITSVGVVGGNGKPIYI